MLSAFTLFKILSSISILFTFQVLISLVDSLFSAQLPLYLGYFYENGIERWGIFSFFFFGTGLFEGQ